MNSKGSYIVAEDHVPLHCFFLYCLVKISNGALDWVRYILHTILAMLAIGIVICVIPLLSTINSEMFFLLI